MRILIAEDNETLAALLEQVVGRWYQVDRCSRLDDALYLTSVCDYSVVILDLGLEDGDGIEFCHQTREQGMSVPILVLTGRFEEDSRIAVLDAGADDYVVKPFLSGELMARIRVLLRRTNTTRAPVLGNGTLRLDPARRVVLRGSTEIRLRRKEFNVLEYLMRHADQVVSRQRLLDQIWDYSGEIANNTVDVHIKYLRDRIDKPFGSSSIRTVHWVGYSFSDSS